MELPKRAKQHVTETRSFKIFNNKIPDHWIVREVTERDYGIDCYLELVNREHQVTGELISFQLKGINKIEWTKDGHYTLSSIELTTTNYWYRFSTPVFLCLVDTDANGVYYCNVKEFIRKNYFAYSKQDKFSYRISKQNPINAANEIGQFLMDYFKEKVAKEKKNHITTFISHYEQYKDFIAENTRRDIFMGVEDSRILYLKHFYNNLQFLCSAFSIEWNIKPLKEYFEISQRRFGDTYELYEEQIDEIVTELEGKMLNILLAIRHQITESEEEYWMSTDLHLYNIMINVKDDGTMPIDWS
jgi:hypothetical protein